MSEHQRETQRTGYALMFDSKTTQGGSKEAGNGQGAFSAPSMSLPKGGGAIRGIGEKFAANPVTGTGSMSVPIATSPGRSGFGPQLSLSYDSGAGNGPFGFGWSLSLAVRSRARPTRGCRSTTTPTSRTSSSSPAPKTWCRCSADANGDVGSREAATRTVDGTTYHVHRYRPRIEGLFARIERWTSVATTAMSTGARSPRTTSSPSTARTPTRASPIPPIPSASSPG